jgi:uncharacterized membrane protein YoaK (UPF0700 family)
MTQSVAEGPLPLALIGLTVVAGLVDAVSYLGLGHVFVANMTGNVVFLGFRAGGAQDFSVALSLLAIGSFMVLLLAFAMGLQTATARQMGVADLTTTVLTLTVTGLSTEHTVAGYRWSSSTAASTAAK